MNRIHSRLGTGFVEVATRRSRDADGANQRTACLDHESASNDDRARKIANSCLHHAGLADGEQATRAAAEGRCGPCLARSSAGV